MAEQTAADWKRRFEQACERADKDGMQILTLCSEVRKVRAERDELAASLAKVRALLAGAACDGCALAEEITEALDVPTEPAPELVRGPDAPTQVSTSPNPSEEQRDD